VQAALCDPAQRINHRLQFGLNKGQLRNWFCGGEPGRPFPSRQNRDAADRNEIKKTLGPQRFSSRTGRSEPLAGQRLLQS
jgi:hypothetical protein